MQQRIIPSLLFDTEAEEAARFYTSIFHNSRIVKTTRYPDDVPMAGMPMTVEFELDGERFVALNGGPEFTFDESMSLQINCQNQEEVDYYWRRLSEQGEEGHCGWLEDRYGASWQVVPTEMMNLLSDADPARARRVMLAIRAMRKLDIVAMRTAADDLPPTREAA
jgi:predicted 3-demethylubiquinone-9 3-methyltransferase (glyoxalase superfamily)